MKRVAFTMRLKPGGLADHRRLHQEIWPELVKELDAAGIRDMTIFEDDPLLFLYSEVDDEGSWERPWATATHERWGELMAALMALRDGGPPDSTTLEEVSMSSPPAGSGRRAASARMADQQTPPTTHRLVGRAVRRSAVGQVTRSA